MRHLVGFDQRDDALVVMVVSLATSVGYLFLLRDRVGTTGVGAR